MQKKPKKGNISSSPLGINTLKIEKWEELYKWQLGELGDKNHKIVTTLKMKDYYSLGLICIKNNISIAVFIREAIKRHIEDIETIAMEIDAREKKKKEERIQKKKEKEKESRLF